MVGLGGMRPGEITNCPNAERMITRDNEGAGFIGHNKACVSPSVEVM